MTLLPASFLATRLWRFWEYFQTWSSGKHELSYEWRRLGQRHFYYWQESWYLKSRASKYVQKKVKSRQMGCNSDNKSAEVQWHGQHAILADTVESNTHRMSSGMAINLNASTLQNQAQCPSDLLLLAMALPQPTPPSDWSGAYIRLPRRMPGYQACTSSSTHRLRLAKGILAFGQSAPPRSRVSNCLTRPGEVAWYSCTCGAVPVGLDESRMYRRRGLPVLWVGL
jgi:hypothetical protein